jgi:phospholipase/carboxylesterase/glyoxalase family protein
MTDTTLSFTHRFIPGAEPNGPILLLLHGTGGDEDDLLGLGKLLLPEAGLLSPRGKVLENGAPRFFRRLAAGVFDEKDLIARTAELAAFVRDAAATYEFDAKRVIAAGFSNGANIAAAMLLLHPEVLRGAVLFRAMVPLQPPSIPDLTSVMVYLSAGRFDTMIPPANTEQLATILREAGADVTLAWVPQGHNLTPDEVDAARRWLANHLSLGGGVGGG